jgi:N utilization substance protein A
MSEKIKLSPDEFRLLSLFQTVTTADARDCIIDEKMERVIFVVNRGQMGMAIGKGGSNIKQLQNVINDHLDGSKIALVVADAKKKGLVVGKDGRNVDKARLLAKRYFNITNVLVISPEQLIKSEKM